MHLCERKKSFIKVSTLILYLKLQTSFFWPIWHFDVKDTGWVSLEFTIIFMQTVGKFYVSDPLHRYTNIGKAEMFHV